jgi:peptidoglycan hydrolase CwlO-like protein
MSRGKTLTEQQFEATKLLKKSGVNHKKIAEVLGIGKSTVDFIVTKDSLKEYRAWQRDRNEYYTAKKAKESEMVETVTVTLPPETKVEHILVNDIRGLNDLIESVDDRIQQQALDLTQYVRNIAETSTKISQRLDRIEEQVEFLYEHTPVSTKRKWGL